MKKQHADMIQEAANVIGLDVETRDDYSGRGMYGEEVSAVVGDLGDIMACVAQAMKSLMEDLETAKYVSLVDGNHPDPDDFIDDLRNTSIDNMGRSYVIY